ncbi:MAG: hypothetical protein ACNS61_10090, partial [Candidatus Wenzhouxiangella sp. M2_3B_020]
MNTFNHRRRPTVMTNAMCQIRKTGWLLAALMLVALPACQGGGDVDPAEDVEADAQEEMYGGMPEGSMDGVATSDTTQLRATYDEIGRMYGQMMSAYDGMTEEMSPEARQL